jgi:hypothetical protein
MSDIVGRVEVAGTRRRVENTNSIERAIREVRCCDDDLATKGVTDSDSRWTMLRAYELV